MLGGFSIGPPPQNNLFPSKPKIRWLADAVQLLTTTITPFWPKGNKKCGFYLETKNWGLDNYILYEKIKKWLGEKVNGTILSHAISR